MAFRTSLNSTDSQEVGGELLSLDRWGVHPRQTEAALVKSELINFYRESRTEREFCYDVYSAHLAISRSER